ncbi:MAG: nucleotidyltransferase domain-containing protein [Candidatus Goldiibacteriota bacterium]
MNASIKKAVNIIVRTADPEKVILFGSAAKGEKKKPADYDLLILKSNIKKKRQMGRRIYMNFRDIGAPIDIIVEETSKYEELKSNPVYIYYDISKSGKVIYEKH